MCNIAPDSSIKTLPGPLILLLFLQSVLGSSLLKCGGLVKKCPPQAQVWNTCFLAGNTVGGRVKPCWRKPVAGWALRVGSLSLLSLSAAMFELLQDSCASGTTSCNRLFILCLACLLLSQEKRSYQRIWCLSHS